MSWGVETVDDFMSEDIPPQTLDDLISALATLHKFARLSHSDFALGRKGLHFHREVSATTHKDQPGKNMKKSSLVAAVEQDLNEKRNLDRAIVAASIQSAKAAALTSKKFANDIWLQKKLILPGATDIQESGKLHQPRRRRLPFPRSKWARRGWHTRPGHSAGPQRNSSTSKGAECLMQ